MEEPQFPSEEKLFLSEEPKPKSFHLFNCDNTYNLDVLETLLFQMNEKLSFAISVFKHYFPLSQMSEMCSTTIPKLQMDFAVFVVHANESRLSINEDNAGIGYAKIYRALLQATGEKVIVVVGGDDNYKNESEEDRVVLSRWVRRKISSQFKEEALDGRKSFVFSWDKKHRPIHEAALLHYFDPNKIGQKFEYEPPTKAKPFKQKSEAEVNPSDVTGNETTSDGQSEAKKLRSKHERSKMETREDETDSDSYVDISHEDARNAVASIISKDLAILCREESEIPYVIELFGLLSMRPDVVSGTLSVMKCYLENNSLKICVIMLGDQNLKPVISSGSEEWPFEDVLRTAQKSVVNKVIVIICDDRSNTGASTSGNDEARITERIERLLGAKGCILWWKGGSLPIHIPKSDPVANKQISEVERKPSDLKGHETTSDNVHLTIDTEASSSADGTVETGKSNPEKTLLLKTRLHHGNISFDDEDIEVREGNWKAPKEIARDLLEKWKTTPEAELLVYRENQKENETFRTVVTEKESCT